MEESADSWIDGVVDELAYGGRRQELILNCHAIQPYLGGRTTDALLSFSSTWLSIILRENP
jgi:hypothetical protein